MDRLETFLKEARDLIASASWTLRIALVLLVAAVAGSFAWLFTTTTDPGRTDLFGGASLSQEELARAEAVIAAAGLPGAQIVGSRLSVPAAEKEKYLAALMEKDALPARLVDVDSNLNGGPMNILMTAQDRKDRERYITQQRLQNIIMKMNGIRAANVQLSSRMVGFPRQEEYSALVGVESLDGQPLRRDLVHAIRQAVASQSGLTYDRVTLTDVHGGRTYQGGTPDGGMDEQQAIYKSVKEMYESDFQRKFEEALAYIPGVKVNTNVVLSEELFTREHRLQLDPKPIAVKSSETGEERSEVRGTPQGRAGAVPNGVTSNSPLAAPGGEESRTEASVTRSDQESVVGRSMTIVDKAGLIPKDVRAAISVPESYYRVIWEREQAAAATPTSVASTTGTPTDKDLERIRGQLKTRIEETINNLLPPLPIGEDPFPRVQVSSYYEVDGKPLKAPGMTDELVVLLGRHWQTGGLALMAVAALVVLRKVMASVAPPEPEPAPATDRDTEGSASGGGGESAADGDDPEEEDRPRFLGDAPDLREELADLVRADPDGAASVLKQWIGEPVAA